MLTAYMLIHAYMRTDMLTGAASTRPHMLTCLGALTRSHGRAHRHTGGGTQRPHTLTHAAACSHMLTCSQPRPRPGAALSAGLPRRVSSKGTLQGSLT